MKTLLPMTNEVKAPNKRRKVLARLGVGRRRFKAVYGSLDGQDRQQVGEEEEAENNRSDGEDDVAELVSDRRSLHSLSHAHALTVLPYFERMTRQFLLLALAYLLGVSYPQASKLVCKSAEYLLVAWITCVAIWIAQHVQERQQPSEQMIPLLDRTIPTSSNDSETAVKPQAPAVDLEAASLDLTPAVSWASAQQPRPTAVHPALEPYFVMQGSERIFPNQAPFPIETDYFKGFMLILIRTPDVDEGTPETAASQYLIGKLRRFEFQFQIQLKKMPTGRVYFACELNQAVKMGVIQRAFISAAMAFIKTTNPNFSYTVSGNTPYMAFPVEEGMNRVVSTPPGQPPPILGQEIVEDPESMKKRKKGIVWNLQDTYTLSLWSAYVDFLTWKVINLPGIRPFELTNAIGTQPIYLTLYEEGESKTKREIVRLEMSNADKSGLGVLASEWNSLFHRIPEEPAEETNPKALANDLSVIEEVDEENAVAELGEGIYVRSGDAIILRESTGGDNNFERTQPCYVTIGCGFAVLQEQSSSTIVIEKVDNKFESDSSRSKLIRSGDTVMFKLISKGRSAEEIETKYLSIHRGWWLKWVSAEPSKNGKFTIYTHETEFSGTQDQELELTETQSSYLTLGGSFWLRHKRWSKYHVGVAAEGSAAYGGRILGLYTPGEENENTVNDAQSESGENILNGEMDPPEPGEEKPKSSWMKPLILHAYEIPSVGALPITRSLEDDQADTTKEQKPGYMFAREHYRMDIPAWIEMMNRADRVRQLVYVVRVLPPDGSDEDVLVHNPHGSSDKEEESSTPKAFIRLRTGKDLAKVMRVGLNWRQSNASPRRRKTASRLDNASLAAGTPSEHGMLIPMRERAVSTPNVSDLLNIKFESFDGSEDGGYVTGGDASIDGEWDADSVDDMVMTVSDDAQEIVRDPRRPSKGRQLIGKLAKSVKTRTTVTSKTVARHGAKLGKGTMNAGKAIIAPRRPKYPPMKEPRSARRKVKRRHDKDLHVISRRSVKRVERAERRHTLHDSPSFLAGELSAPEQSCRTVSSMVSKMSSVSITSPLSTSFSALLNRQVEYSSEQDSWFLQGGAMQVGVVPEKGGMGGTKLLFDTLVARGLWESHWREEWCGVYESGLAFYAALTRSPCLELQFNDIQFIRNLDLDVLSPLVDLPVLVIETAWLCHYIAFSNEDSRSTFATAVADAWDKAKAVQSTSSTETELGLARLWQGFQNSVESSLSSGRGKWADVSSGVKMKRRVVLNNRRMVFDLDEGSEFQEELVEDLLTISLSFSLESLKENPSALLDFLDGTSRLRSMSLDSIDFSNPSAFCMFVNIYHCLLQHSLLFALNGPLQKKSCAHFMRTSCYEIGGEVFSLAELNACVIRGNMSRAISPKAPYVDAPKKSNAYRFYALGYTTPRVNFLLNTGDLSCPRTIPVLTPELLEVQLNEQAADFIQRNVTVEMHRRTILLPKVMDVYRNDFTMDAVGYNTACARYCLEYLDEPTARLVKALLEDESPIVVRFLSPSEQYHSILLRKEDTDVQQPDKNS